MISFRPHKLVVVSRTDGHYDENRYWVEGKPSRSESVPCRYESNGRAAEFVLPNGDGTKRKYSYVVYLDLSDVDYQFGQTVELYDARGVMVAVSTVKGFDRKQLGMKLWI